MYTIYVLRSEKDQRLYVGMTLDVTKRLHQHNSGYVTSTKGYLPWQLVYTETATSRSEARKREKYLKGGSGKEFLKGIVKR